MTYDRSRLNNVERRAEWARPDQILSTMHQDESAQDERDRREHEEDAYIGSDAHWEQVMSDRYADWNPEHPIYG